MIRFYYSFISLLLIFPYSLLIYNGVRAEDQQAVEYNNNKGYYGNNNDHEFNDYNNDSNNNNGLNDEEEQQEDYYWTVTPPPTPNATPRPTPQPTPHPTKSPTARPTWSNEAFYEIDHDDGYTIQEQQAKIYFSSMSDVILCLMCTFFWVLWIVGTIFPTKIQHLYRTEGIVVRGYVVESFTSTNNRDLVMEDLHGPDPGDMEGGGRGDVRGMGMRERGDDLHGLDGMGVMGHGHHVDDGEDDDDDDDDVRMKSTPDEILKESSHEYMEDDSEGMNLPTYHAIVTYVVPGRVASGRRKRRIHDNTTTITTATTSIYSPSRGMSNRQLQTISNNYFLHVGDVQSSSWKHNMNMQQQHSQSSFQKPPSPTRFKKHDSFPPSSDSVDAVVDVDVHDGQHHQQQKQEQQLVNPQKILGGVTNRRKSLLDSHTFDSGNTDVGTYSKWKENDKGYYKYNQYDHSDYESPLGDDEYEDDPEYIGNLFYHFGLIKKPRRKLQPPEPVRVKKRFETNHLLEPGLDNVEIIVLPGNPGSGILKDDFDQEEDLKYGSESSKDNRGSANQMGDLSAGIIGVALSAVSVVGAVHGALTLPYTERIYGWVVVTISLTVMWPIAMYTYKTVHKIRIYMMNKIINLEPCGDTTNLYEGLRKLPRGKMGPCSEKGSDHGNEYVLMLSGKKNAQGRRGGVW
eukprot:CAMPEP_0176486564 /NCGR_PEP_ID=MMETSP0200_2-20121128/5635_1 /TAXON_ID=947934 /ORGANISM="Chaetoceros sp., Strain GSL56" /LENGTH=682 /DNA_ID=CAMNT_0017883273 /DNA_START=250 /DNA_END=2295 /DNA_ORIENTATION=+